MIAETRLGGFPPLLVAGWLDEGPATMDGFARVNAFYCILNEARKSLYLAFFI